MIKGVVAVPIEAKQNTRVQADLNFLGPEKYAMVMIIVFSVIEKRFTSVMTFCLSQLNGEMLSSSTSLRRNGNFLRDLEVTVRSEILLKSEVTLLHDVKVK